MAGIYIHVPFCKQACHYCDFHFSTSLTKKEDMLLAMQKELILRKDELANTVIETIYFGGGTPSVLSITELESLLTIVRKHYTVIAAPEITLEANPDDLCESKIKALASSSINRLSIGVQSFFEEDLKMMNRSHNQVQAKNAITLAMRYFDNVTVDLIYGIPKMTDQKWRENLQMVLDAKVPHISSYALTVEEKTALDMFIKKGKYPAVDPDLAQQHFSILVDTLEQNGYTHYEISNFAKPGFFSKHNASYWQRVSYLGIGPSAHSYNGLARSWNVASNTIYIKSLAEDKLPQEKEVLTIQDAYNEYVMIGLRTIWGVRLSVIEQDFDASYVAYLLEKAAPFIEKKQLELNKGVLKATKKGKFLADGIASDLFKIA